MADPCAPGRAQESNLRRTPLVVALLGGFSTHYLPRPRTSSSIAMECESVALLGWVRIGHTMVRVGLAMLQGARHEHIEALHGAAQELGVSVEVVELRRGDQVDADLRRPCIARWRIDRNEESQ